MLQRGPKGPLSLSYFQESGLYYLQSRYYNPEMGRFLNADALISTGQGLLGNNMFAYCLNNPSVRLDKHGSISYDCYSDDPNNDNNPLNDVGRMGNATLHSNSVKHYIGNGNLLSLDYYIGKKAPKFSTPYSEYTNWSYNSFTQSYELSTAYYDYAGRQVIRIDWTNHGRIDHGNPHIHYTYYDGQYRDGISERWD